MLKEGVKVKEQSQIEQLQTMEQLQTVSGFEEDAEHEERIFKKHKKNVEYLAFCYLTLFVAFNSTQNLVASLYKSQGFDYLGLISLLFIYIVFAIGSLLAKSIISKYSYRQIFCFSALGYTSFILSGILVCDCSNNNSSEGICEPAVIYLVVIICSCLCGLSSATIWVGQGGYMECIFSEIKSQKGTISGIFWSIRMSSHFVGNFTAMVILNIVDNNLYFFLFMGIVALIGCGMFYFIAKVDKPQSSARQLNQSLMQDNSQPVSNELPLSEQINRVFRLIVSMKFQPFLFFTVLGGVALAFSSGFLRNLVKASVEGDEQEVSQSLSFVLITFGFFEYAGGKISGKLADKFNAYYLATIGTLAVFLGLLLSFLGLLTKSYFICFLIGSVFGFIDCYVNNISQVISNNDYKGQLEIFQAQRFIFAVSNACTQVLLLFLSDSPEYTFLTIVFFIALISNFIVSLFPVLGPQEHRLSKLSC